MDQKEENTQDTLKLGQEDTLDHNPEKKQDDRPIVKKAEGKEPEKYANEADTAEFIKNFMAQRAELEKFDESFEFSYDLEASLTQEERDAGQKLQELAKIIADDGEKDRVLMNFFEQKEFMEGSGLFAALNTMPKGALHHTHTTANNPIDAYFELTKDDKVYFNTRDRLFKVYPKHKDIANGYQQCNTIRNFCEDVQAYNDDLRKQILLTAEQANDRESHDIWFYFQHKFTKVGELGKYVPFFKYLTKTALERCIAQNVFVVEYRHISGMLFDDDKVQVPFLEELKIIREVVDELQETTPHFRFRLILTGLKIVGESHVQKMINHLAEGNSQEDKRLADLVVGFDMVNEEDFTPEIGEFARPILMGKKTIQFKEDDDEEQSMPCFFHAGETHDRAIKNLHDSIMLGTKRIGHGFQLQLYPYLQGIVKERDICIEVCPLSNMVLGYTKDLRTHPMKSMLANGVQASINSDDPGLFGYEGVTLDWVYAFAAWNLTIRDLKKLSLNGIKYASISKKKKDQLYQIFDEKWAAWVAEVNKGTYS